MGDRRMKMTVTSLKVMKRYDLYNYSALQGGLFWGMLRAEMPA